ncbi:type I phosphodiesterase/nucleotide pyrophosphatase precursor [Jimgerdemannia flammicorona]|uniref:Type I phosphodiesterase/nucleotide pyrophosphatase n=1 Tax=Jimgerdemannia flammicorona TaxID=994334 RepID=A0A433R0L2_9FUNG|nr:type I phosphodiesterase/nucleotide pyrophosphatase precursor [Jimgerdemannia flammicorona]
MHRRFLFHNGIPPANMMFKTIVFAALLLLSTTDAHPKRGRGIEHVILLSIDGMHQKDLDVFVKNHPKSAFAALLKNGIEYQNAQTSKPSDSFPGLIAQITGGSPKTTGIWYDNSWDRELFPPGSNCQGARGVNALYDESIDFNDTLLDGGGGIDVAKLPLRLVGKKCLPEYPHNYIRVNTIFEVARKHKLHTAWTDKHFAYDIVHGPSGKGVEDLYTPEINSIAAGLAAVQAYDQLHWNAINNWIKGLDSAGKHEKGWATPNLFGGNFQSLSVVQKTDGYLKADGTPSPVVAQALLGIDAQLATLIANLKKSGIYRKTLLIISAKHGQSPIDKTLLNKVDPDASSHVGSVPVAHFTGDDVGLLWLKNGSDSASAAASLLTAAKTIGLLKLWEGPGVKTAGFGNPATDSRVPDVIIQTVPGVIYTASKSKVAEHGGFNEDDLHVPIIVHNPRFRAKKVSVPVSTRQIAPSTLVALGLNPHELEAVVIEHTKPLPELF